MKPDPISQPDATTRATEFRTRRQVEQSARSLCAASIAVFVCWTPAVGAEESAAKNSASVVNAPSSVVGARGPATQAPTGTSPSSAAQAKGSAVESPGSAVGVKNSAALFNEGRQLYLEGRCKEALPKLARVVKQTQSPNARLFLGRCLEKEGRSVEAYRQLQRTMTDSDKNPEKYKLTLESAALEIGIISAKIARLSIAIEGWQAQTQIQLDGKPLTKADISSEILLLPGKHEVLVTHAGKVQRRSVLLTKGEAKIVSFSVAQDNQSTGALTSVARSAAPEDAALGDSGSGLRLAGYLLGGAGVVALASGGVASLMSRSAFNELSDSCGGVRCTDASASDEIARGKRLDTIATVGLLGGGILLASGIVAVVVGQPSETPPPISAAVLADGGAYFTWRGEF